MQIIMNINKYKIKILIKNYAIKKLAKNENKK